MRHNRREPHPHQGGPPGGPRMVPYLPKRIKGPPLKRCYVNNLPYDIKWQQFKDHMKEGWTICINYLTFKWKFMHEVAHALFVCYFTICQRTFIYISLHI